MTEVVTRFRSRYFPPTVDRQTIDFEQFAERYDQVLSEMALKGTWFEDGHNYAFRRAESKAIVLGRMLYYVKFADFLFEKFGRRFYLLDFMTRPYDQEGSGLLYFIDSAEEIHVNLEGITAREIYQATLGLGRAAQSQTELVGKFATAWEINQLFYRNRLKVTTFHTGSSLSRLGVWWAFRGRVRWKCILDDNKRLEAKTDSVDAELQSVENTQ